MAGMKVIRQPKSDETVVVAAASSPAGSLVGLLAKLAGARAVGIAGGTEKCGMFATNSASMPWLITGPKGLRKSWPQFA
jgi:NADPH-dependent curcumin reductase CurA